jgi:hypothetical protein
LDIGCFPLARAQPLRPVRLGLRCPDPRGDERFHVVLDEGFDLNREGPEGGRMVACGVRAGDLEELPARATSATRRSGETTTTARRSRRTSRTRSDGEVSHCTYHLCAARSRSS